MPAAGRRLYLIDGYSNIYRAFHALRDLSNSRGEPTNAVYGFLQMLRKLLREEQPELVGVALDVADETTLRREEFEDYKANRAPMPDELRLQIPWIRRAIEAYRIPILEQERYEADDVMGTLARKAAAAGYDVVLVTADKDMLQLLDDKVSLWHTRREKMYGPAEVEADYGVRPDQIVDYLALIGDTSDNVPGVPLIGPKTAVQLLRGHGSLDRLLENADQVPGKRGENLRNHQEDALKSRRLVTIHTDLPLEFDPQDLAHEPPDPAALKELFRELEFFSLLEELETGPGDEPAPAAVEAADAAAWREAVGGLEGRIFAAVVGEPEPVGLAVGGAPAEDGEPAPVVFADFRRAGLAEAARETVAAWLAPGGCEELAGHDLKEVLRLVPDGRSTGAALFDTMLVSYLLRPALRAHSLEEVALDRLGYKAVSLKEAGWEKEAAPVPGHGPLLALAGERVELPRRLAAAMERELGDGPLAAVYREIEAPLVPVLVGMEEHGVLLDVEFLAATSKRLGAELDGLEAEIYELAGERFNINSPQQLGVVLFEKLGYPVLKKTRKTKSYSTSAETLQELSLKGYDLPERLLRFRELAKLKSTYVDALPALVGDDGRLHTRYQQAVAATGRLSSANPNLQNIPVRTEQGQQIRKAFIAAAGRHLLVADYNQIELRVLAHIAGEPALIEAFEAGEDIHRTTAASVFGVAAALVTAEQRRAAKTINFGIIYGISPFGLAQNLGIPQADAKRIIEAYLEQYAGVKRYVEETVEQAREEGKVETLYGRVRWLPEIKSRNWNLRENARRMAINARIQGTAADLLKKAMIAADRRLRAEHPEARLLLTVHDELVLEVPEGETEAVGELVRREMERVERLEVPLVVDLGHGPTWYDAKV